MNIILEKQVFGNYYNKINDLIIKSKHNVIRSVNTEMVQLYYEIGSTLMS